MYKDPVKLNAFMNHASLTFAVGVCQKINRYLQDVTDQPNNYHWKYTCMLEAECLYMCISKYHSWTMRFCKSHHNTNRYDPKLLKFGVDRVKSMITNTRLKPSNYWTAWKLKNLLKYTVCSRLLFHSANYNSHIFHYLSASTVQLLTFCTHADCKITF